MIKLANSLLLLYCQEQEQRGQLGKCLKKGSGTSNFLKPYINIGHFTTMNFIRALNFSIDELNERGRFISMHLSISSLTL